MSVLTLCRTKYGSQGESEQSALKSVRSGASTLRINIFAFFAARFGHRHILARPFRTPSARSVKACGFRFMAIVLSLPACLRAPRSRPPSGREVARLAVTEGARGAQMNFSCPQSGSPSGAWVKKGSFLTHRFHPAGDWDETAIVVSLLRRGLETFFA